MVILSDSSFTISLAVKTIYCECIEVEIALRKSVNVCIGFLLIAHKIDPGLKVLDCASDDELNIWVIITTGFCNLCDKNLVRHGASLASKEM